MLTLNKTFNDTRAIKVLVVPIGDNSLFDAQFEIVSKRSEMPMYELNRPHPDTHPSNTPFKNVNWDSGTLLFDYLRYDRVSSGAGDLETFQCNRRYLHVIGLINYPELEGSKYRLEEDMDYYTRRYPNVILRRYFVFNMFSHPNSSSWKIPSIPNDPNAIVVFPPEGECEGGNSMIDIHLHEVMAGVALKILLSMETQAVACEEYRLKPSSHTKIPAGMNVFTTFDEMEDGGTEGGNQVGITLSNASSKMKRRVGGRLRKIIGDLCLQACSPLDSLENFLGAISELKSHGDHMWLAGAYEGFTASMLWCLDRKLHIEEIIGRDLKAYIHSDVSLGNAVMKLAEERCVEALSLYSRNIAFAGLEVECALKVARMYEKAPPSSEIEDKEQKVLDFLLKALSVPGLNRQQQMECTLEAAFVCYRLRLNRKYAFFLYLASLFAADSENSVVTHLLMKRALQQYGINFNEESSKVVVIESSEDVINAEEMKIASVDSKESEKHDGEAIDTTRSWSGMRRMLYAQCAHFGKEAGDIVSAARCLAGMMRLLAEADIHWRQSTSLWLPQNFSPDDISRLFLTCNNVDVVSLAKSLSKNKISVNDNVTTGAATTGSARPVAVKARHSNRNATQRNISASYTAIGVPSGVKSASISSLSSSHTMTSFRNSYLKGNYHRLHARMKVAKGRIADLHENLTKQVLDFSLGGEDKEFFETASDADSMRGGFVPGFLSDSPALKISAAKRKIIVPKLEPFVASITYRPSSTTTPKQTTRSTSISSVVGAIANIGQSGDNQTCEGSSGLQSVIGQSEINSVAASSSSTSIFSGFYNSVSIPTTITSQLLDTSEIAGLAMAAAGLVDDGGFPIIGAMTPSTNCLTRTWLCGSGVGNAVGLDKLKPLQDVCLRKMERMCEDLPPSCHVYMGELPFVHSMTPLDLPSSLKPCPISVPEFTERAKAESDSSALYYDPFMAQRDRKKKAISKGPEKVIWVKNTACKVAVRLSNPLSIPIRLSNVALIFEQVEGDSIEKCYEITPESVEIPSVQSGGTCFETILSVTPLKTCTMKLIGLRFYIRNAVYVSFIDENGWAIKKRHEVSPPWVYPRRAKDVTKTRRMSDVRVVSMTIDIVPEAAELRIHQSWNTRGDTLSQSIDSTRLSDEEREVKVLLYDGECRRESIILKNTSTKQIEDIRVDVTVRGRGETEKEKSKNTTGTTRNLLPWSGILKDIKETATSEKSEGSGFSAKAAAAISDHKSYIAEREEAIRLEKIREGVPENQHDRDCEDEYSLGVYPEEIHPSLVRIVALENLGNDTSVVPALRDDLYPITPQGSIKLTFEFNFCDDLMPPNIGVDDSIAGANVTLSISYLSASSNESPDISYLQNNVLYYRNCELNIAVVPVPGISLTGLWLSRPGWCHTCNTSESDGGESPFIGTEHSVLPKAKGNCEYKDIDMLDGDSTVVDHLARLLGDDSDGVEVLGENCFVAMEFDNQSSRPGAVYFLPDPNVTDNCITSPGVESNNWANENNAFTGSCFYEEEAIFGTNEPEDRVASTIIPALRPKSTKIVFVKLNSRLRSDKWSRNDVKVFMARIRRKLSNFRWCSNSAGAQRNGRFSMKKIAWRDFSNALLKLRPPTVTFDSEVVDCRKAAVVSEKKMHQKLYQLISHQCQPDPTALSSSLVSFKIPSVPITPRCFYKFSVRANLSEDTMECNSSNILRQLEVAIVVFEGHHVGMTHVGPRTGRGARARLGASYILPVVSVDPLPAAAAAAVEIASSNQMHDGKSVPIVETRAYSEVGETSHSDCESLESSGMNQSRMICKGVLVSGQIRRMFDFATHDCTTTSIEHDVKLCFTLCGKYTVYTLARERKSSTSTSAFGVWSPWWMDSAPLLLSVVIPSD